MNAFVIDASVAIKWIVDEKYTDEALALFDKMNSFLVPDLFLMELDSVLSKKVRKRELMQQEALELQKEIKMWPFHSIAYKKISQYAFELAITLPMTLYDAMYVATAIHYDGQMITADRRLFNGLKNTPLNPYIKLLGSF